MVNESILEGRAMQTKAVIDRHVSALRARDLEELIDTYADDAVFLGNVTSAPIKGRAALRTFWMQVLAIFTEPIVAQLTISQEQYDGDIAYLSWSAGTSIPFGADTFVVRDGKIVAQTGTVQFATSS